MDHMGWVPDPSGVEAFLNDDGTTHPLFGLCASDIMESDVPSKWESKDPVLLYESLLRLQPSWKRGKQGIGDCVGWGWELACTVLAAVDIVDRREPEKWCGEFATEAIYAGSRVEARGKSRASWSDGSYGAAAAKWVRDWGLLVRKDYSIDTGQGSHDLTKYSADKAKSWGYYGCGGKGDNGKLDQIAREHPVKTVSMVLTFDEAAAAITNGYPVPVCSNQGFKSRRDSEGFCSPHGTWNHCMVFLGVRGGSRPGLLCTNSWGRSVSGDMWPDKVPASVRDCSWWVDASVADKMLRQRDSYAVSGFDGFKRRDIRWSSGWL